MRCTLVCLTLILLSPQFQGVVRGQRTANPARKFDEFKIDYYKQAPAVTDAHLKRFARQLKLEPRARGFMIAYTPRVLCPSVK